MRFSGSARSLARSAKNCFASEVFHVTTEPTLVFANGPIGTTVVTGFRSAKATETSWDSWVPWSTVSEDAAPLAAAIAANGLMKVPEDVSLDSRDFSRTRLARLPGRGSETRHARPR
jgi:hypothetical protein